MGKQPKQNTVLDKANAYLHVAENIFMELSHYKEFFSADYLMEFQKENVNLRDRIRIVSEESRRLVIGIIGAVKAGKSSFLNSLLFNGENFLPKASTPMTATLTKLSYAEEPHAVVHFYSPEDYGIIVERANQYDDLLSQEYRVYLDEYERDNSKLAKMRGTAPKLLSKDEYEKLCFGQDGKVADLKAYKEIVTAVSMHPEIMTQLGQAIAIDGDVQSELQKYVSATGKYTPIVSYVEYQTNHPALQDVEIIDTPGLNDPITSRSMRTKEFLGQCDVALILSPCGQFMDAGVIEGISKMIPHAGVQQVLVIGSKLDSGIRNDKGGSFLVKAKKSIAAYESQYRSALSKAPVNAKTKRLIAQLKETKPLFVSSMCRNIGVKLREKRPLDEEERNTLNDLRRSYADFQERYLIEALSGMGAVSKALEAIRANKVNIIEQRDGSLIGTIRHNQFAILDDILADITSRKAQLETSELKDLVANQKKIRDVINGSRRKLRTVFEVASLNSEKRIFSLCAALEAHIAGCREIEVQQKSKSDKKLVRTGLFGWKKEYETFTVTYYEASVADAVKIVEEYYSKCKQLIQEDFSYLLNEERIRRDVKDVVLDAFENADVDFKKEDILLPLDVVLANIKIPRIEMSVDPYIDRLNSAFHEGYARDEKIHKLKAFHVELIIEISSHLQRELKNCGKQITALMLKQAESFSDEIGKKFDELLQALAKQVENKAQYLHQYEALPDIIQEIRKRIQTAEGA